MRKEKPTTIILKSDDIRKIPDGKLGIALKHIKLKSVTLMLVLEQYGFPLRPIRIQLTQNGKATIHERNHAKIIEDYLREQGVILYK